MSSLTRKIPESGNIYLASVRTLGLGHKNSYKVHKMFLKSAITIIGYGKKTISVCFEKGLTDN